MQPNWLVDDIVLLRLMFMSHRIFSAHFKLSRHKRTSLISLMAFNDTYRDNSVLFSSKWGQAPDGGHNEISVRTDLSIMGGNLNNCHTPDACSVKVLSQASFPVLVMTVSVFRRRGNFPHDGCLQF